jgi:soluble lytic murein transglycosylase-like protein
MHQKVRQSSVILRVFAVILGCFFAASAVAAQEKAPNVESSNQPQAISTVGAPATVAPGVSASEPMSQKTMTGTPALSSAGEGARVPSQTGASTSAAKSKDNAAPNTDNLSNDYKKSLNDLAALFERQVQKLEQQHTQIKALFHDGLVSRVEMEKSDKELVDARAKVEEARNQITEANKPTPVLPTASGNLAVSNAVWSTGNNRVDTLVRFYGTKYGVDPYLIFCLMHQESRFSNNATSPKGAQGLMQLMPGTAARYGVTNPYDVGQSIMGGTRYLKDLLQMFNGRIDLALAGYNAGEGAVIKYGYNIPPYSETRNYVRLITARYAMKPAS